MSSISPHNPRGKLASDFSPQPRDLVDEFTDAISKSGKGAPLLRWTGEVAEISLGQRKVTIWSDLKITHGLTSVEPSTDYGVIPMGDPSKEDWILKSAKSTAIEYLINPKVIAPAVTQKLTELLKLLQDMGANFNVIEPNYTTLENGRDSFKVRRTDLTPNLVVQSGHDAPLSIRIKSGCITQKYKSIHDAAEAIFSGQIST
jgi:hypothetical protein